MAQDTRVKLEILQPKNGDTFGFDEEITFKAKATATDKDGKTTDITNEIRWRKTKNGYQGQGPVYKMSFDDRANTTVAAYVRGISSSVTVKIECRALASGNYSADVKLLARLMMGEGADCSLEERKEIGYVVINRVRSPVFPNTLTGVIYQQSQFLAINNRMFANTSDSNAPGKLTRDYCRIFAESLQAATAILADPDATAEPLFQRYGQHAFSFNGVPNPTGGPSSRACPIATKTQLGWCHSYYNLDPIVNLNQAGACTLETIQGVGEKSAATIIENRPYTDLPNLYAKLKVETSSSLRKALEQAKARITF